jgi:hypothetical protein
LSIPNRSLLWLYTSLISPQGNYPTGSPHGDNIIDDDDDDDDDDDIQQLGF